MSLVSHDRWSFWLGDMPMPDGATDEMMWAAYEALNTIQCQEEAIQGISSCMESLTLYESWLNDARSKGEPTESIENIINLTNVTLDIYRSWLL